MGQRLHAHNLQRLLLPVSVLLVLLVTAVLGSQLVHLDALRDVVGRRDEQAARAAATALSAELARYGTTVHDLALHAALEPPDEALAAVQPLAADFDRGLALLNADGRLLQATRDLSFWESIDGAALLAQAHPGREHHTYVVVDGDAPGDATLLVIAAVTPDTAAAGGVRVARLAGLNGQGGAVTPEAALVLVDGAGRVIHASGDLHGSADAFAEHPGVDAALTGETGFVYLGTAPVRHMAAFSPVGAAGWTLLLEQPWDSLADPWLHLTEYLPLILVPLLLVMLALLWFGARNVVQPLQQLQQVARQLRQGDLAAAEAPVTGIQDIHDLHDQLVQITAGARLLQESLRLHVHATTAGQEDERRRLARDLHDDTIQSLIVLQQRVQRASGARREARPAELAAIDDLIQELIADLRRITHNLRPAYLEELGLVPALERLAQVTGAAAGAPVPVAVTGVEQRLPPDVELAFYRIAQEALSNAARHAGAATVSLQLSFAPEAAELVIADDGRGFVVPASPAAAAARGRFGLLGIHERAQLIGAELAVESAPGQGSRVAVRWERLTGAGDISPRRGSLQAG